MELKEAVASHLILQSVFESRCLTFVPLFAGLTACLGNPYHHAVNTGHISFEMDSSSLCPSVWQPFEAKWSEEHLSCVDLEKDA